MSTPTFTEEEKKLRQPVPTEELIIDTLKCFWNISPTTIKALASYDDANYYIRANDKQYLIKVYNAVESANTPLLEGYSVLLNHISENMPDLHVPIPIPFVNNNHASVVDNKLKDVIFINTCPTVGNKDACDNYTVAVRLFQWVSGETLSSVLQSANDTISKVHAEELASQLFNELGYKLGMLRYCIDNNYKGQITEYVTPDLSGDAQGKPQPIRLLTHPSFVGRVFNWDIRQFSLVEPFFQYLLQPEVGEHQVPEENKKLHRTILDIYACYNTDILPVDSLFEFSTIMGDCNDANVIVSERAIAGSMGTTTVKYISGVIDFGDSIYTYSINEIVIAIAYGLLSTYGLQNPKQLMRGMILQYCVAMIQSKQHKYECFNAHQVLSKVEISNFRCLIAIRLATSVTIGHYSILKNPENAAYLKLHAVPARRAIDFLWNQMSNQEMVDILEEAMATATLSSNPCVGKIPPLLETHRLRITCPPAVESDSDVAALLSDTQTMQYLSAMSKATEGGWTVEEMASRREYCIKQFEESNAWMGNIYLKDTTLKNDCKIYTKYPIADASTPANSSDPLVFVGIGGFREIDWNNMSAEMGIIINASYQRMGLCAEVHYICLTYAFEVLQLNRITFITSCENAPMINFLKSKCLANFEGVRKELFFKKYKDRKAGVVDAHCFSILASDWEKNCKVALMNYLKSH